MNINIRESIISNFKDADKEVFIESISTSINDKEEITLPGLGVFFEILWINASESLKEDILNTLMTNIKTTN